MLAAARKSASIFRRDRCNGFSELREFSDPKSSIVNFRFSSKIRTGAISEFHPVPMNFYQMVQGHRMVFSSNSEKKRALFRIASFKNVLKRWQTIFKSAGDSERSLQRHCHRFKKLHERFVAAQRIQALARGVQVRKSNRFQRKIFIQLAKFIKI